MSSGYGNIQPSVEQIRSKETSTNCLLAKHECVRERSPHARSNGQRDQSSHTVKDTHQITGFSLERIRLKGCCTSLCPVSSKELPEGALQPIMQWGGGQWCVVFQVFCCHNDAPWHGSTLIPTASMGLECLPTSSYLKHAVKRIDGLSYRAHRTPHRDNSAAASLNTLS